MKIYKKLLGQSLAGFALLGLALASSQVVAQEGTEAADGRLEEVRGRSTAPGGESAKRSGRGTGVQCRVPAARQHR